MSNNTVTVDEWEGITLGMWADRVLVDHPNTEWITKATVKVDIKTKGMSIPDLIVTWHYPGADLVLERAQVVDPRHGLIAVYAVQKIVLTEVANGRDGESVEHQNKSRRAEARRIRRKFNKAR